MTVKMTFHEVTKKEVILLFLFFFFPPLYIQAKDNIFVHISSGGNISEYAEEVKRLTFSIVIQAHGS